MIRKSRVYPYINRFKLRKSYSSQNRKRLDLNDIESYRNISKRWRDEASYFWLDGDSTSSQKILDNIFEANAMPPTLLAQLAKIKKKVRVLLRLLSVRR